ncbi:MAG: hypothetical protein LQ337_003578 [Flavoplaca oasis]|nr:MAG: hypothetical protein LQ337_003578 [Flavoplaca oasis]
MSTAGQESGPPEARSPSSISRAFSADLNDAFSMDKNLDGLVQSVERKYVLKKQEVSSEIQELEALETKLKETEERLKEKQASPAANKVNDKVMQQRVPPPAFHGQSPEVSTTSTLATTDEAARSSVNQTPSTSTMSFWRPPMPGTLPETPGDSRQNSYLGGHQGNP